MLNIRRSRTHCRPTAAPYNIQITDANGHDRLVETESLDLELADYKPFV